jgi:hypothetical protein
VMMAIVANFDLMNSESYMYVVYPSTAVFFPRAYSTGSLFTVRYVERVVSFINITFFTRCK